MITYRLFILSSASSLSGYIVNNLNASLKPRQHPATMSKQHCRMQQSRMLLRQSRTRFYHTDRRHCVQHGGPGAQRRAGLSAAT